MKQPRAIWGGLGNQMFQFAALYSMTREFGTDVYCQDERWFIKYADDIKRLYGSGITYDHRIAIHVRRTDMVNSKFDIDLSATDYYKRAMELFPKEHFIIASDDIEWCKQQEIFKGCEFSEGKQDWEDMNVLAGCKGIILANSSFSYWCAMINPYKDKVIICPQYEYVDHVERRIRPKEWLRLEFKINDEIIKQGQN